MKQIKNTVAIAHKSNVRFSHLQQTVNASKEFLSEFNGLDHVSSFFL
jgi:hypothetical protein